MSTKKYKNYSDINLDLAVEEVKAGRVSAYKIAKQYGIPKSTILKRKNVGLRGYGPRTFDREEEAQLESYVLDMAERGLPIGRSEVKQLASEMDRARPAEDRSFGETGASDGWLGSSRSHTGFLGRHACLSLRTPSHIDGGRFTMARESTIMGYFRGVRTRFDELDLHSNPHRVFNIDETGFNREPKLASKVLAAKGIGHPYQRNYVTGEHITALMTIRADGVNLPPMIIFRNCLPKTNYAEMGPENALYRATESGYVNSALYLEYVKHLDSVIPEVDRPVFITQDNLKAHMTLELTEFCRQQKMVMQNFPAKTTHILQPLDACFANLKASFSSIAKKAQLANPGGLVNKANFSGVLRLATDAGLTAKVIRSAFRRTGQFPLDHSVIDRSQLVSDHVTVCSVEDLDPTDICLIMDCTEEPVCLPGAVVETATSLPELPDTLVADLPEPSGTNHPVEAARQTVSAGVQTPAGLGNPLVWKGKVDPIFANILCPPLEPLKASQTRRSKTSRGVCITDDEYHQSLLDERDVRNAKEARKQALKEKREAMKEKREALKERREALKEIREAKKKEPKGKRKAKGKKTASHQDDEAARTVTVILPTSSTTDILSLMSITPPTSLPVSSITPSASLPVSSITPSASLPVSSITPSASLPASSITPSASLPASSITPSASLLASSITPSASLPASSITPSASLPASSITPSASLPASSITPSVSLPQNARPVRETAKRSMELFRSLSRGMSEPAPTYEPIDTSDEEEDDVLCSICSLYDPDGIIGDTLWISCELCSIWSHRTCSDMMPGDNSYICSHCLYL